MRHVFYVVSIFFIAALIFGCKPRAGFLKGKSQPSAFSATDLELFEPSSKIHLAYSHLELLAKGERLSDLAFFGVRRSDRSESKQKLDGLFNSTPENPASLANSTAAGSFGKLLRLAQKPGARDDARILSMDFSHDGRVLAVATGRGLFLYEVLLDKAGGLLDICQDTVDYFPGQEVRSVRFAGRDLKHKGELYTLLSRAASGVMHISRILPRVIRGNSGTDGTVEFATSCSHRTGSGDLGDDPTFLRTEPVRYEQEIGGRLKGGFEFFYLKLGASPETQKKSVTFDSDMVRVAGPFVERNKGVIDTYAPVFGAEYVYLVEFEDGSIRYVYESPNHKAMQGRSVQLVPRQPAPHQILAVPIMGSNNMVSVLSNGAYVSQFHSYGERYSIPNLAKVGQIPASKVVELHNQVNRSRQNALMSKIRKHRGWIPSSSTPRVWIKPEQKLGGELVNLFWSYDAQAQLVSTYIVYSDLNYNFDAELWTHPLPEYRQNSDNYNRKRFVEDKALADWIPEGSKVWPMDHERLLVVEENGSVACLDFAKAGCGPKTN